MRTAALVSLVLLGLVPLTLAIRAGEDDAKTHYDAARAAEKVRHFKAALAEYEKALAIDEDHEDLFERWEVCEALVDWEEALDGDPGPADLIRLGEVYSQFGRHEDEKASYEAAVALDPQCAEAHGHLAILYYTGRIRGRGTFDAIRATTRFLNTSPNRALLARARADFAIYGELRVFEKVMAEELAASKQAKAAGKPLAAAAILEGAVKKDMPDAYRTRLLAGAGWIRVRAEDGAGARAAFMLALKHVECVHTITARFGLAALDVSAGKHAEALTHLGAAVKVGSGACDGIERLKATSLKPLFESEDPAVRAEMERLTDMEAADEPVRAGIRAACEKAGREGKLVLLHWYGPYCPFVMAMEERLAHPEIRKLIAEKFVHLRVDHGAHHRAMTLDREYGNVFNVHGVPSFYVLYPDGSIHSIQKDTSLMGPARCSYSVEAIIDWLEPIEPD
jgi:tetratricopeptide (TPR) repeat protein